MTDQQIATILAPLILGGLFLFIVFLVTRELVIWYFKINQIITRLDAMIQHLEIISNNIQPNQITIPKPPAAPVEDLMRRGITLATPKK